MVSNSSTEINSGFSNVKAIRTFLLSYSTTFHSYFFLSRLFSVPGTNSVIMDLLFLRRSEIEMSTISTPLPLLSVSVFRARSILFAFSSFSDTLGKLCNKAVTFFASIRLLKPNLNSPVFEITGFSGITYCSSNFYCRMSGGKESRSSSPLKSSPLSFMNLLMSNDAATFRSVSSSITLTTADSLFTCSGFSTPKISLTASSVMIIGAVF